MNVTYVQEEKLHRYTLQPAVEAQRVAEERRSQTDTFGVGDTRRRAIPPERRRSGVNPSFDAAEGAVVAVGQLRDGIGDVIADRVKRCFCGSVIDSRISR